MNDADITNIILILIIVVILILSFVFLPKIIRNSKKEEEIEDSINNKFN